MTSGCWWAASAFWVWDFGCCVVVVAPEESENGGGSDRGSQPQVSSSCSIDRSLASVAAKVASGGPVRSLVASARTSSLAVAVSVWGSTCQSQTVTSSWNGLCGGCSRPLVLLLVESSCSGSSTLEAVVPRQLPRTLCHPHLPRLALAVSLQDGCSPHPLLWPLSVN